MTELNDPRILLGRITGAHGIRGDVIVHSFAAVPENIEAYGALSDASGAREIKLEIIGSTGKGLIARVAGVTDRNAAEALRGTELYVARSKLPPADDSEYYHADLIGLAAVAPDGTVIGEVVAIENFGAGDLIEVRLSGKTSTELVPFSAACVPEVDIVGRRVVIVLPAVSEDEPGDAGRDVG